MRHLLIVMVVASCRYGFDPIETPDASVITGPHGGPYTCPSATCVVDCRAWESCDVDCGPDALACIVECPSTGCTVHDCHGLGCDVTCSDGTSAARANDVATCP